MDPGTVVVHSVDAPVAHSTVVGAGRAEHSTPLAFFPVISVGAGGGGDESRVGKNRVGVAPHCHEKPNREIDAGEDEKPVGGGPGESDSEHNKVHANSEDDLGEARGEEA